MLNQRLCLPSPSVVHARHDTHARVSIIHTRPGQSRERQKNGLELRREQRQKLQGDKNASGETGGEGWLSVFALRHSSTLQAGIRLYLSSSTSRQFTSPIYLSIIVLSRPASSSAPHSTRSTTIKCLHHNCLMMFNQPNYSTPYGRPSIRPFSSHRGPADLVRRKRRWRLSSPVPSLSSPISGNYDHYPFASSAW